MTLLEAAAAFAKAERERQATRDAETVARRALREAEEAADSAARAWSDARDALTAAVVEDDA